MRIAGALLCATALVVVARARSTGGETRIASANLPTPALATTPAEETTTHTTEPSIDNPDLAATVALAAADLATRLQIDRATIELVDARRVTWPDESLGCPQTGEMYAQTLVAGSKIVLGTNGRTRIYVYHAGADGQPFLCPSLERDGGHDFVPPPGFET